MEGQSPQPHSRSLPEQSPVEIDVRSGVRSAWPEHNLAKVGVVGSNPIARSNFMFYYNQL